VTCPDQRVSPLSITRKGGETAQDFKKKKKKKKFEEEIEQ